MNIKFTLICLLSFLINNNNFSQNRWTLETGAGISISKMVNASLVLKGSNYEVDPIVMSNGYVKNSIHLKNNVGIYLRTGYLITGFTGKRVSGFCADDISRPLHRSAKIKYHYIDLSLGGNYYFKQTKLFLGVKYLKPIKRMVRRDLIGLYDENNPNHEILRFCDETIWYQHEETQNRDLGFEVGIQHDFLKNVYIELYFFRGFLSVGGFRNAGGHKLYNQSLQISFGYQFNLKK